MDVTKPYKFIGFGIGSNWIESSKTYPYPRGLAGPEIVEFGGLDGPPYRAGDVSP